MESKKLGEHIAKLRRERHMTQTELADRLYIFTTLPSEEFILFAFHTRNLVPKSIYIRFLHPNLLPRMISRTPLT